MLETRVSFRYAKALLEIATQEGMTEIVFNDIQKVKSTLELSKELRSITSSPTFRLWKKKKIFKAIFSDEKISDLTLKFLIILLDKRRGILIPSIVRQYEVQYYLLNNILEVKIISALELSASIKEKVIKKLSDWTKMTILPEYKIDANVKGGLLVRIDDWVFDATVKHQLEKLFKALSEGID